MNIVLNYCDKYILSPFIYSNNWPENNIWRQLLSLTVIVNSGAALIYILAATLSYYFVFDQTLKKHPLFLKDQIFLEINYALRSIPLMSIPTLVIFMLEIRGYSKLYDNLTLSKYGYCSLVMEAICFIAFTDALIYWIHRMLHYPPVYIKFHKQHHKWKVPTPFASHAFHPLDGFAQSLPYHIYPFLFPLSSHLYLLLFVSVNVWTVSIHDGVYSVPTRLKWAINGAAHHTDHHLFYRYNYGQFTTIWDRIGRTYKDPSSWNGTGPADLVRVILNQVNGINCSTNDASRKREGKKKVL